MKIVYLTAGAADMYCGTCLHDNTLAAAMLDAGHDMLLTPLYTPTRTDERNVSGPRIFFSGINVFLQQKSWLFRHTPWLFDKLFESPRLLRRLTRRATATAPEQLGDLTVSMLLGEEGRQRKELDKLLEWLRNEKPDVVHLSNSLLMGSTREIRRTLGVPVVCSLSGEDIFIEKLVEPHYARARDALRQRSRDIDVFVALNDYYAEFIANYLGVDRNSIQVIRHGLDARHYEQVDRTTDDSVVTIGYLARICADKGLHLLIEAAEQLAQRTDLPPLRFRAAGYLGISDRPYLEEIEKAMRSHAAVDFEYVGELDLPGKIEFLSGLDIMALPTVYGESKGISALESLAVGTPIVVPDHGVFPELIADTGGGKLFEPGDSAGLAARVAEMLLDPDLTKELGNAGKEAISLRYRADRMAEETLTLYKRLTAKNA